MTPRSDQGERPCGVCRHFPLSYGYSKAASTLSMLSGVIATLQTTLRPHHSSRYATCSKYPELGHSNSIIRYQTLVIRYDLSWRKPVDRPNDQPGPQDSTLAERISKNSLRQTVLKSRGRGGWWGLFLQWPQNSKNISSYLCLFCWLKSVVSLETHGREIKNGFLQVLIVCVQILHKLYELTDLEVRAERQRSHFKAEEYNLWAGDLS